MLYKREMWLFSAPDCGRQGDHGHSFFSIMLENRIAQIQNIMTAAMLAIKREYSYCSIYAHLVLKPLFSILHSLIFRCASFSRPCPVNGFYDFHKTICN